VAPWYAWVGAETKAHFLKGFLLTHNVGRFLDPMENHSGPIYYYLAVLLLGFAPWSIFLGMAIWSAVRRPSEAQETMDNGQRTTDNYRFLWCWITVYIVFFSLARTKLPNYILPIYPPVAILTAQFLDRWRRGVLQPPAWTIHLSLACLVVVGIMMAAGLLLASGVVEMPLLRGRRYPGLEAWAVLGIMPVIGAGAAWWCVYRQHRNGLVIAVTVTAILFLGILGAGGSTALEKYKAPRTLAQALPAEQTEQEIRVATYRYFQPSLVFYCQREVKAFREEQQVLDFLRCELPVYLFVPAPVWEEMESRVYGQPRLLARRHDLYTNCEVVVVTNW